MVWPGGRVVRQGSAKPRTAVQFRSRPPGRMAELVDAQRSGRCVHFGRGGSNPLPPTKIIYPNNYRYRCFSTIIYIYNNQL